MAAIMDYLANNPAWQQIVKGFPDAQMIFTAAEQAALAGSPWDSTKFQSEIQNTNWFKTTPAGQRQYLFIQVFDPASATRDANDMALKILNFSNTMGLHMTLQQGAQMADQAIIGNWDDSRIQQEIVGATKYSPGMKLGAGTVSASQTQIQGLAGDYGVSLAPQTAYSWASKIADGLATTQSFSEYAKQQAVLTHPYWQQQLDQGMTVRQLADPYIQNAAKLLEIDPSTVNLTDPKWNFATTNDKGQQAPMSQSAWQTKIMQDPTYGWDKTQNAKDSAIQVSNEIRTNFGAM